MVGVRHSLSAGELYTIVCRARGSRPPPSISWRLGAEDVSSLVTELVTSSDGVTSSSLQLRALPRHHGQLLSCEAAVPGLASAGRLDSASVLNVHHLGPASLQLGRDLASPVREGEDAYLECEVEANPRPSKVAINDNYNIKIIMIIIIIITTGDLAEGRGGGQAAGGLWNHPQQPDPGAAAGVQVTNHNTPSSHVTSCSPLIGPGPRPASTPARRPTARAA